MPAPDAPKMHPSEVLLQMENGFIVSACINVVVRLEIADKLAEGPKSAKELAKASATNENALYRVLRTLASVGVFKEVSLRQFALTSIAEEMRKDKPLHSFLVFNADPWIFNMYAELMHSVQTGEAAPQRVHGYGAFEHFEKDKEEGALFNAAMTSLSAQVVPAVLEAYDFSSIGTLVDVAGGHGFLLLSILKQYPQMRGVLLDLPHVVDGSQALIDKMDMSKRCEPRSVDFFKSVPPGGDAYIMKNIIHDWDDEKSIIILKNIYTALQGKREGKLLLVEAVIPPGNDPHPAKFMDMQMLVLAGGIERTEAEFRLLLTNAGFELTRIVPTRSMFSVIEAVRV